jgi:hypothetical protein
MKALFSTLSVLALLLLTAPAFAAPHSAPNNTAPSAAAVGDCGVDLAQLLAAKDAVCRADPIGATQTAPLDLAVTPHCCSTTEIDACRNLCKQQQPGCKGVIGCRAGECVCTCDCP